MGTGISVTKNAKIKAIKSLNHENAWDLGRDWEMKKIIIGKVNRKLVETLFSREREKTPFFVKAIFSGIRKMTRIIEKTRLGCFYVTAILS